MLIFLRKIAPTFLISWYHFLLSFLGALFYGFPSRNLVVIGVTGTNGKSTTVDMISRIFEEAGLKTASLSSIRFRIQGNEQKNMLKMTMPGRFFIQQFLRRAVSEGCTHAVVEVTSEGILQHRHRFIRFRTAILTNISPEHIERHGSFEKYREAKARLFQASRMCHVLNADDQYAQEFLRIPSKKKYLFSKNALEASLFSLVPAEYIQASEYGSSFSVQGCQFHLKLPGVFNVMNALAAICAGLSQGISLETCKKALESIERIPGRMEQVVASPFRVFVDYAFTPAALEKVYETVRPSAKQLICVLGSAGGGRDKWKRPVLGKIAAQFCDTVIVTNEDPYNEDPEKIMEEVMQGAGPKAQKIQDRRQAIRKALLFAKEGDVVMITGKGSEDSIAQKDKKIPWDDREVAKEEFSKLDKRGMM